MDEPSSFEGWRLDSQSFNTLQMSARKKPFNDQPFPYHHEVEMDITSLTNMGQGVGRVDGWVVMVAGVIPGERVRVRIFRNHKNYSEADLAEVLTASPQRVEPGCGLFGTCGGCQYQHISYPEQLRWKRQQVQELMLRMAEIAVEVKPVIGSPREYAYRAKLTPHFHKPKEGEVPAIGFLHVGTRNRIVDVPQCPIATEAINAALPEIREGVRENAAKYRRGATLLVREALEGVVTDPGQVITEEVDGVKFRFLAGEFFQNNPFILERLTRYVTEEALKSGCRYLIDAYCGSGLFCLTASRHFTQAAGVEISEASIRWARENAELNQIENCSFVAGDASSVFAGIEFPAEETAVIIDPPRRGSDELFLSQLFAFGPKRVVYVSCNPATQIRDMALFLENGYELDAVQPFDLFPQTKHLECVASLSRQRTEVGGRIAEDG